METKIRSFRFDDEIMTKLDAILSYHQRFVDATCSASKIEPPIHLSRTQILKKLIEKEHKNMTDNKMIP